MPPQPSLPTGSGASFPGPDHQAWGPGGNITGQGPKWGASHSASAESFEPRLSLLGSGERPQAGGSISACLWSALQPCQAPPPAGWARWDGCESVPSPCPGARAELLRPGGQCPCAWGAYPLCPRDLEDWGGSCLSLEGAPVAAQGEKNPLVSHWPGSVPKETNLARQAGSLSPPPGSGS